PRFTQQYFNLSPDNSFSGPWNEGEMPGMDKEWEFISDPAAFVQETEGLTNLDDDKTAEMEEKEALNLKMSEEKSEEVIAAEPDGVAQWSDYSK
ncbi:MAG: manganese catalase family protein, partial [Pedobacter sp.]